MVSSNCSRPVVLITGAASGIGAATARLCASRNWIVYATDTDTQFPPAVEADCRCHELDVTDAAQCKAVVDRILDETGRIDVLVNNAGFAVPGPIEDVSVADSRFQFDVVVHGSHRMTQTVLPAMRARGEGRILMLSSVLGVSPSPGLGSYGAAKAALESLTDSLRMELRGTGISVSLIEPAWVDTSFAERARDRLKNVQPAGERAAAYSDTYAMVESGWALTGGPFALSPETVAETVVKAATDDDPKARYPVGTRSRLVMAGRLLPDRLREALTTTLLRGSVSLDSLWPGGEQPTAPTDSKTLSTGQTVSVPLETEASVSGVVLSASRAVDRLLPDELVPVRLTPTRSAVLLLSVEYHRIDAGEIEPYNEVGIMVPAVPDSAWSLPVISGLSSALGGYVWRLPVTTEPACALGREIWGYPKSVADIGISTSEGVTATRLAVDDQRVLSLAVERPPTSSMTFSTASYTIRDGECCRTSLEFDGQLGFRPLSRRVDWSLGTHPWAETLSSLSLGSRALARFAGECTARIGPPQPQ